MSYACSMLGVSYDRYLHSLISPPFSFVHVPSLSPLSFARLLRAFRTIFSRSTFTTCASFPGAGALSFHVATVVPGPTRSVSQCHHFHDNTTQRLPFHVLGAVVKLASALILSLPTFRSFSLT